MFLSASMILLYCAFKYVVNSISQSVPLEKTENILKSVPIVGELPSTFSGKYISSVYFIVEHETSVNISERDQRCKY